MAGGDQDQELLADECRPCLLHHDSCDHHGPPGADAGGPGVLAPDRGYGHLALYRHWHRVYADWGSHRRPGPHPAGHFRILDSPVPGGGSPAGDSHDAHGHALRAADGPGRRPRLAHHRDPGRLLWTEVIRQHHGHVDGADERPAADCPPVRGLHVRHDAKLRHTLRLGGHRKLLDRTRSAPATYPSRTRARRERRRTLRRSRPPRRALSSAAARCPAPRRRRGTAARGV